VESLKELNQICQKPRYKEVGNWMVRHILREASLPITWLLLHTKMTANQVTLVSLIAGMAGGVLFAFGSWQSFLGGALLLQIWYLLDHVDGQIARYRQTACLTGRFFDYIMHHAIHGVIFFSLGIHCFTRTGSFIYVWWGFAASLSMTMFNLMHDTKYKTLFEGLAGFKMNTFFFTQPNESATENIRIRKGILRQTFSLLHKLAEIHVLMNILSVAAIAAWLSKGVWDLRLCLMIFYGVTVPVIGVTKIAYWICRREIDREFEQTFKVG
jgi:phosphatidylglycerophosphate synthase